jgi:hypothetical protein
MPATENARIGGAFSSERTCPPTVEAIGPAEWAHSCARCDICRSALCQVSRPNTDCLGSRKGN